MKNNERMIVRIIKEICTDEAINFTSFSYDWILRLEKDNKSGFIYGYNFGINNASAAKICDDKCAVSDVLIQYGIPTAVHYLFMSPENIGYIGQSGSWGNITKLFDKYTNLVCKANEGTGGAAVFLVKNKLQLEAAVHKIFKQNRTMAVSPYYNILKEYRAIVLDGKVKLAYAKNIPYVVGDGKRDLRNIFLEYMAANNILLNLEIEDEVLDKVLQQGEKYNINWKSNLCQGAVPEIVKDEKLLSELSNLSLKAAKALSIDFASVDIIITNEGMKVLEVNCGIMMENFIRSTPENYDIAKQIYTQAVRKMIYS